MRSISFVAHTLAVALLSWAVPEDLHAETIAVRSGEHDGFTRIVLDLPNPRDWTLDQNNASAKLVLKGARSQCTDANARFSNRFVCRVGSTWKRR